MFVFDTTGSMGGYIDDMKASADAFADALATSGIDYRLGLTEFDDFVTDCGSCGSPGDEPYKIYNGGDLTDDPAAFKSWVNTLIAGGGNDWPESHLAALHHTITDQHWRGGEVQKIAILISDAMPHNDADCCNVEGDTFAGTIANLNAAGVKVFVVGYNDGWGYVPDGWATDLATSTGGKFYKIDETDLLPILEDIVATIKCSFTLDSEAACVGDHLDICVQLKGKDGALIPYEPGQTSAKVVMECGGDTLISELAYNEAKAAYCATIAPVCPDESDKLKLAVTGTVCDFVVIDSIEIDCIKTITVPVDIKPGSCPNTITSWAYTAKEEMPDDISAIRVITVAVLGTDKFDVKTIDPSTTKMSREGIAATVSPLRYLYKDVATPFTGDLCGCHKLGADKKMDLYLIFEEQKVVNTLNLKDAGDVKLSITGNLNMDNKGIPIRGEDCISVLSNKETQEVNKKPPVNVPEKSENLTSKVNATEKKQDQKSNQKPPVNLPEESGNSSAKA